MDSSCLQISYKFKLLNYFWIWNRESSYLPFDVDDGAVDILVRMKSLFGGGMTGLIPDFILGLQKRWFDDCWLEELIRDDALEDGSGINVCMGGGRTIELCWEWGNITFELEKLTLIVLAWWPPNLNWDCKDEDRVFKARYRPPNFIFYLVNMAFKNNLGHHLKFLFGARNLHKKGMKKLKWWSDEDKASIYYKF